MSWASQRKAAFTALFTLIFLVFVGGIAFLILFETPSCSDGKQNGEELGIDCGGGCSRICASEVTEPVITWARHFEVVPGLYNVLAMVDNPNRNAVATDVAYRFKLFDEDGILVAERTGTSFLLPDTRNPIFEAGIETGERRPARAFFEILSYGDWSQGVNAALVLRTADRQLESDGGSSRLTAVLVNDSLETVAHVEAVALLYDEVGNVITSSRTLVPRILGGQSESLIFTWPQRITDEVIRIEIVVRARP